MFTELKNANAPKVFGNKTAILANLVKKGIDVPDGFGIPVDYFYKFCKCNGLSKVEIDSIKSIDDVAYSKLIKILDNGSWDFDLYTEMFEPFKKYNFPVCVRSSGTNEDGKNSSMAGNYTSYINIKNYADYLRALRICWKSAYNPQIIQYLHKMNEDIKPIPLLVQKFQPSAISGVAFNSKKQLIISAVYGLCSGVVSGNVPADNYIFDKKTKKWEKKISYKNVCYLPIDDNWYSVYFSHREYTLWWKNTQYNVFHNISANEMYTTGLYTVDFTPPADLASQAALSDKQLKFMYKEFNRLSRKLGFNQGDFEWCIDSYDHFHILQARPYLIDDFLCKKKSEDLSDETHIVGTSISKGKYTGKAVFYKTESDLNKIESGDVVVFDYIPDDFMGVVSKVGAIIFLSENLLSHCAIIARELGIPCVGGICLEKISEGMIYLVDGDTGIIQKC